MCVVFCSIISGFQTINGIICFTPRFASAALTAPLSIRMTLSFLQFASLTRHTRLPSASESAKQSGNAEQHRLLAFWASDLLPE